MSFRSTVFLIYLALLTVCLMSCSGHTVGQGNAGPQGIAGPKGDTGADGTSATVVQLCPGTSNHNVFVEVALCLDKKLYAVYSQNGGFLTLLSPGEYSSRAIGSACDFYVAPNCVIERD